MSELATLLENNIYAIGAALVAAAVVIKLSGRIMRWRLKRAIRIIVVIMMLPIFYPFHPFLFYQVWMFCVIWFIGLEVLYLMGFFAFLSFALAIGLFIFPERFLSDESKRPES